MSAWRVEVVAGPRWESRDAPGLGSVLFETEVEAIAAAEHPEHGVEHGTPWRVREDVGA